MHLHPNLGYLPDVHIETERLLLVPITIDYADAIFDEFTEDVTQYMYPAPPRRIQDTELFIREALIGLERGNNLQLVVLDRRSKEFLGCAGLHNLDSRYPELGIWLKRSAQGQALGKEAIFALKDWADRHVDYNYLLYPVDARNHPSRRIPEALGGKMEKSYWMRNQSGNELEILEYRIYPLEGSFIDEF